MSAPTPAPAAPPAGVVVLLVDDQAIVGAAVRRMLADEKDIAFHFCQDPAKAVSTANAVGPTVILQDLVMPDVDGLTLVKFFRANPATRDVPLIVLSSKEEASTKAQAFAVGANDYLVKLPDKLEVVARVRYHSKGYVARLERNEAYRRLAESQALLAEEVGQAAKYVMSLLPPPLASGPVKAEWKFVPSTSLGGDSFGYHWLDEDHLAVYLLDVSGHGVGSSLLSVSAMNVLRSQALPRTDFRVPDQVLTGLNDAFQMEQQADKYFTIFYGVYHRPTRTLRYAGGGHPSALLFTGEAPESAALHELESQGPGIGMWPGAPFETGEVVMGPFGELYIFSDGVFEVSIAAENERMWQFKEFADWMRRTAVGAPDAMGGLLAHARSLRGRDVLDDDFSIVRVRFE